MMAVYSEVTATKHFVLRSDTEVVCSEVPWFDQTDAQPAPTRGHSDVRAERRRHESSHRRLLVTAPPQRASGDGGAWYTSFGLIDRLVGGG